MDIRFTEPQIQHLMEYGDENWSDMRAEDNASRDKEFSRIITRLKSTND